MTITTQFGQPETANTLTSNMKGKPIMRKHMMTILGGALVLSLTLTSMAFAGIRLNGPELTGTRAEQGHSRLDERRMHGHNPQVYRLLDPLAAPAPGLRPSWRPSQGPALTGTRTEQDQTRNTDRHERK